MNGSGGGVVVCGGACDGDGIGGGQVTACPDHSNPTTNCRTTVELQTKVCEDFTLMEKVPRA